jgi:hypothetical protein
MHARRRSVVARYVRSGGSEPRVQAQTHGSDVCGVDACVAARVGYDCPAAACVQASVLVCPAGARERCNRIVRDR